MLIYLMTEQTLRCYINAVLLLLLLSSKLHLLTMMAIKIRLGGEPSSSENTSTDAYSVFPVEMIFKSSFLSAANDR